MDEVYKELDELKTELSKLKEDYRIKTELSDNLRRAHSEQLVKNQEANLQIEKQSKELNEKSEELAEIRQLYGEAKSKLHDLESSVKELSFVNDKIRVDTGGKVQKLEGENRRLVSALEEVTGRNDDLERKLSACGKEIEGLKTLLSESQQKCLEAEEKARSRRELRHREEVISKLEEESMSIQDQLKWKKEQFGHLEEAHWKLQDLFQSTKKEWAVEKLNILEEMEKLKSKLDSQIRITEGLESRLKMCNQALAHEESRRKALEVQLSESKQCFDSILAEYEEAKAQIESFSTKRDEDIASLRNSLGMKEILLKDLEYKVTHLEEDNKELLGCLKELREAQINKRKVDPSVSKIRNKLKDLEQVHGNCAKAWKEREVEWTAKMEKLMEDMKCYESDLKGKGQQMSQLRVQLDQCYSELEVLGEESSILLVMMKSELSEAYSKLFESDNQIEAFKMGRKKENEISSRVLENGDFSLSEAQAQVKQAHEEILSMTQKLESMKLLEERSNFLEGALVEHNKMLEEFSECQLRLKEQASEMEIGLKNLFDSLEKSNSELAAKIKETTQTKIELQVWKSKAESFKTCLEQVQELLKQTQNSLLEQVEKEEFHMKENESLKSEIIEREKKIDNLQNRITYMDQKLMEKEEVGEDMKLGILEANKRAEQLRETLKERDSIVEDLQGKIEVMEEEFLIRKSAFELEKEELCRNVTKQKDEEIRGVQNFALSLERDFKDVIVFSFSQGISDLVKIVTLEDALGKSELLMTSEIERKNDAINVLQKEVSDLKTRMLLQEESLVRSRKSVKELEDLLEVKKIETEKVLNQLKEQQTKLKETVGSLKQEREAALASNKMLSFERDNLFAYIEGISEQFGEVCKEDKKLEGMLGKLLEISEKNDVITFTPHDVKKEVEATHVRSPLREINH